MKFIICFLSLSCTFAQYSIEAPAGNLPTKINKEGKTVIPNGRFITPAGIQFETAPHPYGLCLSHDGNTLVTANSGTSPFSITIISNLKSEKPKVIQIPNRPKEEKGVLEACFMGLAFSNDDKVIYVAGGQLNAVIVFDAKTGKKLKSINCAVKTKEQNYSQGYLGDMVMTKNGKTLFVVDQIGFRIVELDLVSNKVVRNIPTGRYPFGITLSPDQSKLLVANVGVFEYKAFTDLDRKDLKNTAHVWPSSKYGSKEMIEGDEAKGVPALGDPNDEKAFSVWVYDNKRSDKKILGKIKTGTLVGEMIEDFPAVGGSSPNSLVSTNNEAFISNGNNDNISVLDLKTMKISAEINLKLDPLLGTLKGNIPFGVALSADSKRLFVAESGINALAVIDVDTKKVIGHIPTGWFPSKVQADGDGKTIYVANAKGYGSGPNGGKDYTLTQKGSYIGSLMNGSVSKIEYTKELIEGTKKVLENNFKFVEKNSKINSLDSIKYVVFIAKENRTYDEVFGQLSKGNGDASIARYGIGIDIKDKNGEILVDKADIMPNHTSLAHRFSISDNFFCDSDVSADGHRWLVNTYPNEWVETSTAASYGGKRKMIADSEAPGNMALIGSSGAIYPEDYNEGGSMWEHLERNEKDFFNFGFGVEMAAAYSDSTMKHIGELYTVNYPLPAPIFDKSSRTFPTYNMAIPDQFRADEFMREFNQKWEMNGLPNLITLMLPNDHGTRPRPKAGFPYTESYMADNDLALGRTVEFLSKTKYWKNMLIVVTEDDPQGGVDHIDAHRSILMTISPYSKKDFVGKVHYSFGSIFKTFWDVFRIPYLNQYDAGATNLADLLTNSPDFTPYNAQPADIRIFDPQKALDPFDEKFDWKAFSESEEMDKTETMQKRREEDDKIKRKNKN